MILWIRGTLNLNFNYIYILYKNIIIKMFFLNQESLKYWPVEQDRTKNKLLLYLYQLYY